MSDSILIIGGGGHAKHVIETLRLTDPNVRLAILDKKPAGEVLGVPVIGTEEFLGRAKADGFGSFAMGIGGVRDNRPRADAFARARAAGLLPKSVVHPSAVIAASATMGAGTQCLSGAIIAAGAILGEDVIINSGAIVEHDCRVGDHVHIASGAIVTGTVDIAAFVHVGAGAVIRQGLAVGAEALVAMGSVVTKNVPPKTTVMGNPARPRH